MRNKHRLKSKTKPIVTVIYILVFILLIGVLGYLVRNSKEKAKQYEETIAQLSLEENQESQRKKSSVETESQKASETTVETELKQDTIDETEKIDEVQKPDETEKTDEVQEPNKKEENNEVEPSNETKADAEEDSEKSEYILLLNGSTKEGMAALWKAKLEEKGYKNIIIGSLREPAKEKTEIYCKKESEIGLKEAFPNAAYQTEIPQLQYELAQDETLPNEVDTYIVIGKEDRL